MRLSIIHEGWDELGIADPSVQSAPIDNRKASWQQLKARLNRNIITMERFAANAVDGLLRGVYDASAWYDLCGMLDVPESTVDEIMELAHGEQYESEDVTMKRSNILMHLIPYIRRGI